MALADVVIRRTTVMALERALEAAREGSIKFERVPDKDIVVFTAMGLSKGDPSLAPGVVAAVVISESNDAIVATTNYLRFGAESQGDETEG